MLLESPRMVADEGEPIIARAPRWLRESRSAGPPESLPTANELDHPLRVVPLVRRDATVSPGGDRTWLSCREVYESLDLALRVGEVLLSSGAGAADVTATMLAVTHACGLRNVSADVTFIDLTLHHQSSIDEPVAIQVRRVTRRRVDYADLTEVDQTVADLIAGVITRDEARDQVARTVSTGHLRRSWTVTLGWGVMGTGIALTLGGSALVCLLAFLAACVIDRTKRVMSCHRIPSVYLQAAGGFLATLIAVTASATPLEVNPSRVVTTGIVMLLAGIGLLGGTQDAMTGLPGHGQRPPARRHHGHRRHHRRGRSRPHPRRRARSRARSFKPGAAGLATAGMTVVGAALAAAGSRLVLCPRAVPDRSGTGGRARAGRCAGVDQSISVGSGAPRSPRSPSGPSATSSQVASGSHRSWWWCPRSSRSCRDWTSTKGSPSSPRARTGCSHWPPRSGPPSRSRPG